MDDGATRDYYNRGGTVDSPCNQHLFIDNLVIAREYIGPMHAESGNNPGPVVPRNLRVLQ